MCTVGTVGTVGTVAIPLSALQSIELFGIFRQPILVLSWQDVKYYNFTWRKLRALGLEAEALKQLQPDKHEWLQRGGIQVTDLIDMIAFPVNPLTDFGVDLAELWQLRCSTQNLVAMGITFEHLIQKGITPQIMAAFALPLSDWTELGFSVKHAQVMRPEECKLVFNIEKTEFINILRTFQQHPTQHPAASSSTQQHPSNSMQQHPTD
jgi:hypothetical protein